MIWFADCSGIVSGARGSPLCVFLGGKWELCSCSDPSGLCPAQLSSLTPPADEDVPALCPMLINLCFLIVLQLITVELS